MPRDDVARSRAAPEPRVRHLGSRSPAPRRRLARPQVARRDRRGLHAVTASLSAHASLSVRRSRAWRPARTPRRVRVLRRARAMPHMQLISAARGAASSGAANVERAAMRCACGAAVGGASILGVIWPEARRGPRGAYTGLAVLSPVSVGGAAGTREPAGAVDPRLAALVLPDALKPPQPPRLAAACTSA